MKKVNINRVKPSLRHKPILGRIYSAGFVLYAAVLFIPGCFWYGAKEFAPDVYSAVKKALSVAFLPWEKQQ